MDESEIAPRPGCESSRSSERDAASSPVGAVTRIELHHWESQDSGQAPRGVEREADINGLQQSLSSATPSQTKNVVLLLPFPSEPAPSPVANPGSSSTSVAAPRGKQAGGGRVHCNCLPSCCGSRSDFFEYGGITAALLIITALFSLPIGFHFYHDEHTQDVHLQNETNPSSLGCSALTSGITAVYFDGGSGQCNADAFPESVCSGGQFLAWQDCLGEEWGLEKCAECHNQSSVELDLRNVLQGIVSDGDCQIEDVEALLCRHAYSPCNVSSGAAYPPSQEDCWHIENSCGDWWNLTRHSPVGYLLPNCSSLLGSEMAVTSDVSATESVVANCSAGFGMVNDTHCQPLCSEWSQYSFITTIIVIGFEVMSATVGLTTGVVAVVVMLLFYRNSFPRFLFMLLMTVGYCIISGLIIVSQLAIGSETLFCTSPDLTESMENPTPYCTITGVLTHFFVINITLCWFIHIFIFFYKLIFPFRFKAIEASKWKRRLFYASLLLIAYLAPLPPIIPALVVQEYKYTVNRYPPSLCAPHSGSYMYYSTALPLNIVIMAGCMLLVSTLHKVHKSFLQVKRLQRQVMKEHQTFHTAETKLMLLSLAFIAFAVVGLVYSSIATADLEEAFHSLEDYFVCESQRSGSFDCNRKAVEQYNHPILNVITVVLLGLIPAVNFLFLINWRVMKAWALDACFHRKTLLYRRATMFYAAPTISTFVKYSVNEQPTYSP